MTKQRFTPAYPAELRERGVRLFRENRGVSCCRFRGHEDKIVTKELECRYDETEVQPRVQS